MLGFLAQGWLAFVKVPAIMYLFLEPSGNGQKSIFTPWCGDSLPPGPVHCSESKEL